MKNALEWVARDSSGYVYSYHVKPMIKYNHKLGTNSFFVRNEDDNRGYISHGSDLDYDLLRLMECVPKHVLLSRALAKDLEYYTVYLNRESHKQILQLASTCLKEQFMDDPAPTIEQKDHDFDWHDVTIKMSDDGEFMVQCNGLTSISAEIVGAFENLRQMQQNERRKYFENNATNNNQQ